MTVMIVLCTAFAGCTEDSLSSGSVPGPAASKIINSRANAVPGGLIIKLDSRSSGQVASMTRGGAVPAPENLKRIYRAGQGKGKFKYIYKGGFRQTRNT